MKKQKHFGQWIGLLSILSGCAILSGCVMKNPVSEKDDDDDAGDTGSVDTDTADTDTDTDTDADTDTDTDADTDTDTDSDTDLPEDCTGIPNFTPCSLVTSPDRSYDICVDEICVSPGCGDAFCNVPGPHFSLADTNQRKCYDNEDELAYCPASGGAFFGQDAQYGWDTGHSASTRYTRNLATIGQPVVTDNVTGLVWQGCSAGLSGNTCGDGSASQLVWEDALAYCDSLTWGEHDDWRLPDEYELDSIVDLGVVNDPRIDQTVFPATPSSYFWTSSSDATYSPASWFIDFYNGYILYFDRTIYGSARCVRSGSLTSLISEPRLAQDTSSSGYPVVIDNVTSLMWQGCPRGLAGNTCATGTAATSTWEAALSYCEDLDWAGHQDWRLPNFTELSSIADNRRCDPAINTAVFPATTLGEFWTSTTDVNNSSFNSSFVISFYDRTTLHFPKNLTYYVRCVRSMP